MVHQPQALRYPRTQAPPRLAIRRAHGLGDVAADAAAEASLGRVLADAQVAVARAQAAVDATPLLTLNRAQLVGIWNANVRDIREKYIPLLKASIASSATDAAKRAKWLGTAKVMVDSLQSVAKETKEYSVLSALSSSLESAIKTMVQSMIAASEYVVGVAARSVIGPLLQSPLFWAAGALGLLYVFRAPLTTLAVRKVDRKLNGPALGSAGYQEALEHARYRRRTGHGGGIVPAVFTAEEWSRFPPREKAMWSRAWTRSGALGGVDPSRRATTLQVKKALQRAGFRVHSVSFGAGTAGNWIRVKVDGSATAPTPFTSELHQKVVELATKAAGREGWRGEPQISTAFVRPGST